MSPSIALVTARAARALDEDLPPLQAALLAAGARVEIADWDDRAVEWSRFDLALLRSTWDYTDRLDEFLAWSERVSELTALRNSAATVCWNTDSTTSTGCMAQASRWSQAHSSIRPRAARRKSSNSSPGFQRPRLS